MLFVVVLSVSVCRLLLKAGCCCSFISCSGTYFLVQAVIVGPKPCFSAGMRHYLKLADVAAACIGATDAAAVSALGRHVDDASWSRALRRSYVLNVCLFPVSEKTRLYTVD